MSLAPFIACAADFRKLYWFGDEWDQLEELRRFGTWSYLTSTFAENFVPLFKAMWLSLIIAGRGSYFIVLSALWLTHALNVLLLGIILRRAGLGGTGVAVALVLAGLPASNIETLGWTVQWSAVLALSFYLLALLQVLRLVQPDGRPHRALWLLAAASLASSLSFSRGVLSGCAIALASAIPLGIGNLSRRYRIWAALAALLPAAAVGAVIASHAQGNHRHLLEPGAAAMASTFAAHFFLLNPFQATWRLQPRDSLLLLLGASKLAIYAVALIRARGVARWLVSVSLLLDAANSVLVGIGRYHTGLAAAVGSRYQYVPLFCLSIPIAVLADWFGTALRPLPRLARTAWAVALAMLAWSIASPWAGQMRTWSVWRGVELRRIVQSQRDGTLLPFVATVSTAEAQLLRDQFHLH